MNRALCSSVATVLLLCGWTAAQDKDLRDQYGTRSLEAAQKIKQAIDAAEQKQFPKAQAAIDAALKADPNSQMAQFWRGIILSDIGDIDEALKSLEKAVTAGAPPSKYISVQAATNRGLLLGRLKRYDESNHWFSRALLEDPLDREKGRWVAYRNMAINLQAQGQFYSAAVAALLALESNPEKVDRAMIRAFAEKATSANQEVVRVFFRDDKTALPKPAPRAAKTELIGVDDRDLGIPEEAQQVLADPQGRYILALVVKGAQFYRVRTDGEPGVTKVPVEGTILAGALAGGTLFAVLDSPPRLIEISPESGKVLRTHPLGQRAATSVAALPARGLDSSFFSAPPATERIFAWRSRAAICFFWSERQALRTVQTLSSRFPARRPGSARTWPSHSSRGF